MNATTCPAVCPPCGDSALSITGNVIGIITLANTLIASAYFYYHALRHADEELAKSMDELKRKYEEIQRYDEYVVRLKLDPKHTAMQSEAVEVGLGKAAQLLDEAAKSSIEEVKNATTSWAVGDPAKKLTRKRTKTFLDTVLRRTQFVVNQESIRQMMAGVDDAVDQLKRIVDREQMKRSLENRDTEADGVAIGTT